PGAGVVHEDRRPRQSRGGGRGDGGFVVRSELRAVLAELVGVRAHDGPDFPGGRLVAVEGGTHYGGGGGGARGRGRRELEAARHLGGGAGRHDHGTSRSSWREIRGGLLAATVG